MNILTLGGTGGNLEVPEATVAGQGAEKRRGHARDIAAEQEQEEEKSGANTISPFIFSVVSAKNSELLVAFREARDMVDKQ